MESNFGSTPSVHLIENLVPSHSSDPKCTYPGSHRLSSIPSIPDPLSLPSIPQHHILVHTTSHLLSASVSWFIQTLVHSRASLVHPASRPSYSSNRGSTSLPVITQTAASGSSQPLVHTATTPSTILFIPQHPWSSQPPVHPPYHVQTMFYWDLHFA